MKIKNKIIGNDNQVNFNVATMNNTKINSDVQCDLNKIFEEMHALISECSDEPQQQLFEMLRVLRRTTPEDKPTFMKRLQEFSGLALSLVTLKDKLQPYCTWLIEYVSRLTG